MLFPTHARTHARTHSSLLVLFLLIAWPHYSIPHSSLFVLFLLMLAYSIVGTSYFEDYPPFQDLGWSMYSLVAAFTLEGWCVQPRVAA